MQFLTCSWRDSITTIFLQVILISVRILVLFTELQTVGFTTLLPLMVMHSLILHLLVWTLIIFKWQDREWEYALIQRQKFLVFKNGFPRIITQQGNRYKNSIITSFFTLSHKSSFIITSYCSPIDCFLNLKVEEYVRELNGLESRRGRKELDVNNVIYWFKNTRAAVKRSEIKNRNLRSVSSCMPMRSPSLLSE